ncbi:hypothetical protein FRX31_010659 [Thalictrum thalictroides]|uniref:Uncharacterized protein n=1 Tax=Thalictrum thalictroides TaxID=46969 RepID=A0A7J6WQU7_THATH|nr:hypothetical protein FRX31_010659 [Thalictrum thalictroides]
MHKQKGSRLVTWTNPLGRKVNPILNPVLPYRIGERLLAHYLAMDPRGSQLTYRSQSAVNLLIPVNKESNSMGP